MELLNAYYVMWGHNAIDFICLKRNKAFASFDEPDVQSEVTSVCVCKGRYMYPTLTPKISSHSRFELNARQQVRQQGFHGGRRVRVRFSRVHIA